MSAALQLSVWDLRDDDGTPLFPVYGTAGLEPMSARTLTDELGGDQRSGCQRAATQDAVENAIRAFFDAACDLEGEERAAVLTLHLIARDQSYQPAPWLVEKLALHREACLEEFHRSDYDRQTDESFSWRDDADEEPAPATQQPYAATEGHP